MKKSLAFAALILGAGLALTGCSTETVGDRSGGEGTLADVYEDATNVIVYRNADSVPNVAYFCLGRQGWASTLSSPSKASALVRFVDYDATCIDKKSDIKLNPEASPKASPEAQTKEGTE